MNNTFTIGIEEELQVIDPHTLGLSPNAHLILPEAKLIHGDSVKYEGHLCMAEICSGVCRDIRHAGERVRELRKSISQIAAGRDLLIASAGTHPFSSWEDQPITDDPFFRGMEEEFQDVARSSLTFGLHVHIGVTDREAALQVINGLRPFLPMFLALCGNSPFFGGRDTGYESYRSIVYNRLPRSGIPEYFEDYRAYEEYLDTLKETGCLPFPGKIWWDARIHPFYETVEIRICDAQTDTEDTLILAAAIQALVKTLYDAYLKGEKFNNIPTYLIRENRWRAGRYGLEGNVADFENRREIPCREAVMEMLKYISRAADELGTVDLIEKMMNMMEEKEENRWRTGAEKQREIYWNTGDFKDLVKACALR